MKLNSKNKKQKLGTSQHCSHDWKEKHLVDNKSCQSTPLESLPF